KSLDYKLLKTKLITKEQSDESPIIGRSPVMQDIYKQMARLMGTDLTVLLSGESGTGKELVARALHDMGKRGKGPFVAVNMAAIPKDLIESELFGYEKGAFTGAQQRNIGRFEEAKDGTLFLDEIGDMPLEAQTRLLRVLQQGEYRSIGGKTILKVKARIISATNKNLEQMVRDGNFREDLFYRLNVVPILIPPLRNRKEDIPDLVNHFSIKAQLDGLPAKTFNETSFKVFKENKWPGNVRELENLIRRLSALYSEPIIDGKIIELELKKSTTRIADNIQNDVGLNKLLKRHLNVYFEAHSGSLPPIGLYSRFLKEIERPLFEVCLDATSGNQVKTAELLGLNRNTLRKKLTELKINPSKRG
ncbi:MAG: sigma 54-interacting transcriptional regulator, partial [Sphingomonadales bacterium]